MSIETIKTKWTTVFGKVQLIALQKITSPTGQKYLVNGHELSSEIEANYQFDLYKDLSQ